MTGGLLENSAEPLWTPKPETIADSEFKRFCAWLAEHHGVEAPDFESLHLWSVRHSDRFWAAAWDFFAVQGDRGERLKATTDSNSGTENWMFQTRFLPDATLNVAENLLGERSDEVAVIFRSEAGEAYDLTRDDLHDMTAKCQQLLLDADVSPGDRVAAWMPNRPETLAIMLAAAGLGAVFSSASPDFGPASVLDRFSQITPAVLFACPDYHHKGRLYDRRKQLDKITAGLPSLRRTVVVEPGWLAGIGDSTSSSKPVQAIFEQMPFDHPWYVLFSSGTTGLPKCIVHRTGGLLLKHLVEHSLHCDVKPGDRVKQTTTTGWMMWNKVASALACRATLVLYDGAPAWPTLSRLFDLLEETRSTMFGTSSKFIDACRNAGLQPVDKNDLAALRTITSTGSILTPEGFEWVYENVKADVHLASVSGGTDLCGGMVTGDPTSPVYPGEIQRPHLGLDIDVTDYDGVSLPVGVKGELVCRNIFPTMPLKFMNDPGNARYRAVYFERIPGLWHHSDFAARTANGGFVILGRSDTTLNPSGVRIGTAEIYRCVEILPEIEESLVVGQPWKSDTRIVLFVRMAVGCEMTDELRGKIKRRLRENVSPRHVPAVITAVPDMPRTHSGKLTELAVRDLVSGRPVLNTSALANPEALEHFRDLPELAQ